MKEALFQSPVLEFITIESFPHLQMFVKFCGQGLQPIIVAGVQVEMQNGVLGPFLFQILDGETLEEFALAAEIGIHRGDEQTLAEASRTTEEVITSRISQFVNKFGLIHIHVSVIMDFLEVLYSNGIFHVIVLCRSEERRVGKECR